MPVRLVLDAATDVVDGLIRQPDGVEVIHDQDGVGETLAEGAVIAGGGVQGGQADACTR
jgi:hypothetical protein